MDYSIFRERLRQLLDSRSFSMKSAADEIGTTAASLSRYLTSDRTPNLENIIKIALYFNVSVDWMLGLSGERFDVLPKEIQDVAYLYSVATPDDRRVVQAVLNKYKGE